MKSLLKAKLQLILKDFHVLDKVVKSHGAFRLYWVIVHWFVCRYTVNQSSLKSIQLYVQVYVQASELIPHHLVQE